MLHWGPGILHWECLSAHGSEADPEGLSDPYKSTSSSFPAVRRRKCVVRGRVSKEDALYLGHDDDDTRSSGNDDSDDELWDTCEASGEEESDEEELPEKEPVWRHIDDLEEEKDVSEDGDFDPEKIVYEEWQKLVANYSQRELTKPTDKVPAFLGLSKMLEPALRDESVAGIWRTTHLLPSLLWTACKPGGRAWNPHYPSWTWVSVAGARICYRPLGLRVSWEPSEAAVLDARPEGGVVALTSTVRRFPANYKFWRYSNRLLKPWISYTVKRGEVKSARRLREELLVVEGFRDLQSASPEAQRVGRWEGAAGGCDIYCVVIARIAAEPPAKWGYPAFRQGRPKSLVCLCLTPAPDAERVRGEGEARREVFRRVGWCHFWDSPLFWKGAARDQRIAII